VGGEEKGVDVHVGDDEEEQSYAILPIEYLLDIMRL
jgi:hypothetical protein